jgi:hypothetical protein
MKFRNWFKMRLIIVCLIIFIVGYSIGNQGIRQHESRESSLDTIIMENQFFREVSYQVPNRINPDSLIVKQGN